MPGIVLSAGFVFRVFIKVVEDVYYEKLMRGFQLCTKIDIYSILFFCAHFEVALCFRNIFVCLHLSLKGSGMAL